MVNYQNGKIYVLRSHKTDDIYIGSTTQSLYKRFYEHKKRYKNFYGEKNMRSGSKMFNYDDCYIELYELYPCNTKQELEQREGEIIRNENCINKRIEGRTQQEWNIDNREKVSNIKKKWKKKKVNCAICNKELQQGSLYNHKKSKHNI